MKKQNNNNNQPGNKTMRAAYKLGSELVKDRLRNEDVENIEILEEMDETDVLVVRGTYDHIHLVLKYSGLPFKEITPDSLMNLELRKDQTIFVNCASNFPPESARKLAGFVASGGQLITTDWALQNVLEVAFPDTVCYNKKATSDEVVRIEILDKEDPILKGFLDEEGSPTWWLEGSSYPIKILDNERVNVLVRSKELGKKYGEDAVIISFEHGEGKVYHMISHFYLQRTETRDKMQAQKSSAYSSMKGAFAGTQTMFEEAEAAMPDLNYAIVQSASTSAEFVNRALIQQKKKYRKNKK